MTPSSNPLLAAWSCTLARFGPLCALFSPDRTPLRSFEEIEAESRAFEQILEPLAPGSVVGVQLSNGAFWPAVVLALFRRRLIPLPLGNHMEAHECQAALEACRAAALLSAPAGILTLEPAAHEGAPPIWEGPAPDFLKLTSGTTALPRAIRFRAAQLLADADQICATMGIGADDLNFGVIPFSHSYGFSNLITPLLAHGVGLVVSEDRMPRAILNGLAASAATVFPGMPVFYQKLAELENVPPLPRLRLCISAGAPLPVQVGERFTEKFGLRIHPFYGASECGGIAYDAAEEGDYREGFVGTAMRGVALEALPGEACGAPIRIRSEAAGEGYFPASAGDAETLGGGVFVPSDLVHLSAAGELTLAGRVSDWINVAGRKLNPLELEACLLRCPGVRAAVVFGVPSVLRGEEPVACVVAEARSESIQGFCQSVLSAWQVPRDFWQVEEIPVNERGKINRRALCALYLARG